jgi:hypothetical protein
VTREDFRRELGDAFDDISGSPNPALPERVRSALVGAPERRDPVWIAALAAAVIAVLLVGVLLFGNPLNRGPLVSGGGPHSSPSPCFPTCPGPAPTPTPSSSPSPSLAPSPSSSPFTCGVSSTLTGNQPPPSSFIDAVRSAAHPGYDRLTIEFNNAQPSSIELSPQSNTTFTPPSGKSFKIAGNDGLLVTIHVADAHTAYKGSTDMNTGLTGLVEVRQVEDFEGYVQWGLGLAQPACYRTSILTNPTRLVIDIQTS